MNKKYKEYSPAQARLVYTLSEPDWQWGGENTAHFSFRSLNGDGTGVNNLATQDFTYRVISEYLEASYATLAMCGPLRIC